MLQALEELAMSYDQRGADLEARDREIESIQEQLNQKSLAINGKESEAQLARDTLAAQRKKYAELVSALIRDVIDVGECMNSQLQVSFTKIYLCFSASPYATLYSLRYLFSLSCVFFFVCLP